MPEDPTLDDNRDPDRRVPVQAERRLSIDRRGWPFGFILRTAESYRVIEEWLED